MPGWSEEAWGGEDRAPQRSRGGLVSAALAATARGRRPWVPDHTMVRTGPPSLSGHTYTHGTERDDAGDSAKSLDGDPDE